MALAAFFFSVMSLLVKSAARRLPSQEVVFFRSLISLVLCWAALYHFRQNVWGVRRGLLVLRGLLGFGALSCFFYALAHLPLADATVIQYTNPVFTAFIAAWLLREHMRRREVVAVALSLAGVVLVAHPVALFGGADAAGLDPVAVVVGLAGAIFSASAYVVVRKLGQTERPLTVVHAFALISVLGAVPATSVEGVVPRGWEWPTLLGVGIATWLGQLSLTRGLARERAGRATAVGYLQIIFAATWGALFFGEIPDGWSVAGTALVVGGTLALAVETSPSRSRHATGETGPSEKSL